MSVGLKRVLSALLGLLLIAYLCYHAFVVPYQSIETEQAVSYTARDTIEAERAYIIRTETTIESDVNGSYRYAIGNGERVASGSVIADVYQNDSVVQTLAKIDDLERQIENLESLNNYASGVVVDISQLNDHAHSSMTALLNSVGQGDFSQCRNKAQEFLTVVNRRQTITGQGADFSSLISSLKTERENLIASTGKPVGSITAPSAGYFVASVDGYENAFNIEDVDSLTPEKLNSIQGAEPNEKAVGKVVSDVTWYIAVAITFEQALQFSPDDKVDVDISTSEVVTVPAKVLQVNKSAASNEAVLILSCSYMNSELSSLRTPSVSVVLHTYDGLRVSDKAIRVSEGKKGVYTSNGTSIEFVPVKVLYTGNGYVVCERADPMKKGLHIYDDVVVKGKNLYDGKSL